MSLLARIPHQRERTFEELEAAALKSVFCCSDPCHNHTYPVQVAYAVEYRRHHVSVVVDGDCYSVQIDRRPQTIRENVSRAEMLSFVEEKTK